MKRLFHHLLALILLSPLVVLAADADMDGLPDDWELANGRDPSKPDYIVGMSPSYNDNDIYGTSPTYGHNCTVTNGRVNCGSQPAAVTAMTDVYGLKMLNYFSGACVQHGAGGSFCWDSYMYPQGRENPSTYGLATSFSDTGRIGYPCGSTNRVFSEKLACSVTGPKQISCTEERHEVYLVFGQPGCASNLLTDTTTYTTRGTIGHIAGRKRAGVCAMTEYGPECFAGTTTLAGVFDADNDAVAGLNDAFPLDASESVDTDNDGTGNNADLDDDNDGLVDATDNCLLIVNTDQADLDHDGVGDACDSDVDGDGLLDNGDNCRVVYNPLQEDADTDGLGDACDVAPLVAPPAVRDVSFNPGSGFNSSVYALAVQGDGKLLVGGDFFVFNGISRYSVARLETDGSLDAGFNPGSGANNNVSALALQQDGKIVIGGYFTSVNGVGRNYIARLNVDGSLDSTFSPVSGPNAAVYALAVQPDGKLLIGGYFTSVNGVSINRIARLNADGSLDTGFGTGVGPNSTVFALALQPDGKVVLGGAFTSVDGVSRNYIARLNADGSLDTSFSPVGGASYDVTALALQQDNKIIVGGYFTAVNGVAINRIARLNADGSLDATFSPGSGVDGTVRVIAVQADRQILIGGAFTKVNDVTRNRLARLNPNGSLDSAFDVGSGFNGTVNALAIQGNGLLVCGGSFSGFNGVAASNIARLHTGDVDSDRIENAADNDNDNDGIVDMVDNCPLIPNADQADMDLDGVGDVCDPDLDGDGVPNAQDAFPLNPAAAADVDGDGLPDAWLEPNPYGCIPTVTTCNALTLDPAPPALPVNGSYRGSMIREQVSP